MLAVILTSISALQIKGNVPDNKKPNRYGSLNLQRRWKSIFITLSIGDNKGNGGLECSSTNILECLPASYNHSGTHIEIFTVA